MNVWTLNAKDGWTYNQDNSQRWKKRPDGSTAVETVTSGETLTQQQYKDDTDVNVIMARFMKTGQIPLHVPPMLEGDFSQLPNYQDALETIKMADQMFMELPALARKRFENNPQELMDFLNNPENKDEAIRLGLLNPPQQPPPMDKNTELLSEIVKNTKPKRTAPPPEEP